MTPTKASNQTKTLKHDPFQWNTKYKIQYMVLPGLMADTGIIRWPINFPPSSKAAILREARVGRITCQRSSQFLPPEHPHHRYGSLSHLFEDNRLLIPHWVDGVVVLGGLGLQCFSSGVCRKSKHFYLYVHTHPPLGQKLARNHLKTQIQSSTFNLAAQKTNMDKQNEYYQINFLLDTDYPPSIIDGWCIDYTPSITITTVSKYFTETQSLTDLNCLLWERNLEQH